MCSFGCARGCGRAAISGTTTSTLCTRRRSTHLCSGGRRPAGSASGSSPRCQSPTGHPRGRRAARAGLRGLLAIGGGACGIGDDLVEVGGGEAQMLAQERARNPPLGGAPAQPRLPHLQQLRRLGRGEQSRWRFGRRRVAGRPFIAGVVWTAGVVELITQRPRRSARIGVRGTDVAGCDGGGDRRPSVRRPEAIMGIGRSDVGEACSVAGFRTSGTARVVGVVHGLPLRRCRFVDAVRIRHP